MRPALLAIDALLCSVAVVVVIVAISGGTAVTIGGLALKIHSAGRLVALAAALAALRYRLRGAGPFLGRSAWDLRDIGSRAVRCVLDAADACRRVATRFGPSIVVVVACAGLVLKIANAIAHPGFFSGDDVEIDEMTLGHAFRATWPIWDLRSPFFPMTTIYPVQAALIRAGVSDVASLVLAGRVVMAVLSSAGLWVIYLCASRLYGRTLALVATVILATESLQIVFGGLELPRTLSAVFVVLAFFFLRSERTRMAALTGVCLALAACLRFSEVVFMLPALLSVAIERRWREAVVLMAVWMLAAGVIQAASDTWYWGEAFYSARAAFRFTVVDRLSSRGYEPPWAYLTALNGWTDMLVFTLAVVGTRRATWQLASWCWLPIVELSALPHKEPRYLIPVLPFVALLAAFGLRNVSRLIRAAPTAPSSQRLAAALMVALPLRCVADAAAYHVNRSDAQVALASVLDARPETEEIAVEQAWKFGGHLYFRLHRAVDDLSTEDLASTASLAAATRKRAIRAVAISATSCERTRCDELLLSAGFRENVNRIARDAGYRVFERR